MKLYWPRLTMLGRSFILVTGLLLFNAGCWVVAVFLFRRHTGGDGNEIMGLAMLAWVGLLSTLCHIIGLSDVQIVPMADDRTSAW